MRFYFFIFLTCFIGVNQSFAHSRPALSPHLSIDDSPLSDLNYVTSTGLITTLFAKEMCSCHFISGVPLDVCFERDNLSPTLKNVVEVDVDEVRSRISVTLSALGKIVGGTFDDKTAVAQLNQEFNPNIGCEMVRASD